MLVSETGQEAEKTMNNPDHPGVVRDISLMDIPGQIIGIDRSTAASYQDAIRLYSRYVADNNLDFSFDSVRSWLETLSASTMNARFYALKKCLLEYYRNHPRLGELLENLDAIRNVKVDKSVKQADYLTREEVERLASGVPERLSLIIMALFWTGCRISELLSIRLKDCIVDEVVTITIIGKGKNSGMFTVSSALRSNNGKVQGECPAF
jgi:integrase